MKAAPLFALLAVLLAKAQEPTVVSPGSVDFRFREVPGLGTGVVKYVTWTNAHGPQYLLKVTEGTKVIQDWLLCTDSTGRWTNPIVHVDYSYLRPDIPQPAKTYHVILIPK